MKTFTILSLVLLVALTQTKLTSYNADITQTSTSGISAGGYMAVQFQVAYSQNVVGSGVLAGGPYYCAQGNLMNALYACMSSPGMINEPTLEREIKKFEDKGQIDSLEHLKKAKMYLYSGTKDSVVKPGVMESLQQQLESLEVSNIKTNFETDSEHAWITNNYGNKCTYKGSPYINNCNLDAAQEFLEYIYGDLKVDQTVLAKSDNLIKFDQTPYIKAGISMNDTGYVYVPTSCQSGEKCKVHVAFHGCQMTLDDIGTKFVEHAGLNEIAEQNNIIVLYPQVKKSQFSPQNPNGCFDWWGYSDDGLLGPWYYSTNQGKQMVSVWNMVKDLTGQNDQGNTCSEEEKICTCPPKSH